MEMRMGLEKLLKKAMMERKLGLEKLLTEAMMELSLVSARV